MSMTLINVLPVPVPRHTMVFLSFARSRSSTWYGRAENFPSVSPSVLLSEAFSMVSLIKISSDYKKLEYQCKALNCNPLQNERRFNWEIISDTVGQKQIIKIKK